MSTNSTSGVSGTKYNAVYTDKKKEGVQVDDFLNLMVQQLANQDFMNPVDDTQYLAQLAQFATMQQMQTLAEYSQSNYAMSLLGKNVTVASIGVGGRINSETGPIDKISLVNGEYNVQVNGKTYTLEQIMEIHRTKEEGESSVDVSNKTIAVSDITSNSASFEWPIATTDSSLAEKIKYNVYYSTNENFSTVEEIIANGTRLGEADRTELTSESIKGLASDTTYYVNVIVTDENNNRTAYQKGIFKTLGE